MNEATLRRVKGLSFGEAQSHEGLTVLPLILQEEEGPEYLTLSEALASQQLTVSEVSASGRVPELQVENKGSKPVLILDGEELMGAKQNRVLNTTVLIKEHCVTVVPVSCTEHGRWSYTSPEFSDSGVVMASVVRVNKLRSVSASLSMTGRASSDQGQVWEDIDAMCGELDAEAPTGAMRDVFESRSDDLKAYTSAFPRTDGQHGLLASVNGRVVGLDVVSRASAYTHLHDKLVKSYAMEALLSAKAKPAAVTAESVEIFLARVLATTESTFPSIGYGTDCRYSGEEACGSALVHDGVCIHAAFFGANGTSAHEDGRMSGPRQRRRYRNPLL